MTKEEPKQELNCFDCNKSLEDCTCIKDTIVMEQERMYSEEDLKEAFKDGGKMSWTDINQETQEPYYYDFNEWFEQFKKKV
jgi:hypothetical protein